VADLGSKPMRRVAILAVVLALAGCGGSGATGKAKTCREKHGWKVEQVSTSELTATRVHAGLTVTLTYRPPAQPVIEIPSANIQAANGLAAACFRG
jgi:ABC-type glycerol-3-phosphate transport system substrate-binding protein